MNEAQRKLAIENSRTFDISRGSFEPVEKEPARSAENPKGTRHIDKTYQDHQPVGDRQRVKDAEARRKAPKETSDDS
jgi:hypothetical protein